MRQLGLKLCAVLLCSFASVAISKEFRITKAESVGISSERLAHRAGCAAIYRCESYAGNRDSHNAKREACTFLRYKTHGYRHNKTNAKGCHPQNRIDDKAHNLGRIDDTLGKRSFSAPGPFIDIHTRFR